VVCNSLGIAEFYDLKKYGKDSQNPLHSMRLSIPSWAAGFGHGTISSKQKETLSGELLTINYRCAVNCTVDGERIGLYSAVSMRTWLVVGTDRGSIIRVLWTGEIVQESEIDVFQKPVVDSSLANENDRRRPNNQESATASSYALPERCPIQHLSIGWNQRVAFVSKRGACGVVSSSKAKFESSLVNINGRKAPRSLTPLWIPFLLRAANRSRPMAGRN
jgi:hypothetical protein